MRDGTRRTKAITLATAALAVVALLAGCSFAPSRGETAKEAKKSIENIEGVHSVFAESESQLYVEHGGFAYLKVTLAPGYEVRDSQQALNWLLETAWSFNDHKLDEGIFVDFDGSEGKRLDWGWQGAALRLGLPSTKLKSGDDPFFSSSVMAKKYGAWPGKVPPVPTNLTVAGSTK